MIAYLDTSAIVPLLIKEPSSKACRNLWDAADDVASNRIAYVEVAAALAQAERMSRLTSAQGRAAIVSLEQLWNQVLVVEVDHQLVTRAALLARTSGLRGYDAVHAASAEAISSGEVVAATGDTKLLEAWSKLGLNTYDTNAN